MPVLAPQGVIVAGVDLRGRGRELLRRWKNGYSSPQGVTYAHAGASCYRHRRRAASTTAATAATRPITSATRGRASIVAILPPHDYRHVMGASAGRWAIGLVLVIGQ